MPTAKLHWDATVCPEPKTTEEPIAMSIPHTIPYGISSFSELRQSNGYFVDRTHLIPVLEQLRYQLFLRPRRFGKSLLLSMLRCYYDVRLADRFDDLFGGTWIHDHSTDDRGKYLILRFDFSKVSGATVEELQANFEEYCQNVLDSFLEQYAAFVPAHAQAKLAEKKNAPFSSRLDILTLGLDESPIGFTS